jgi:hypothetical protein
MKQKFQAKLLAMGPKGAWTKMPIPFNVAEVFGMRSQVRVKGTINGIPFQNSLMPVGDGTHMMNISKALQTGAEVRAGEVVTVIMDVDYSERSVEVPAELQLLFKKNKDAAEFYAGFSYSHQKEYADWIAGAKKPETRVARAEKAIAMIFEKKRLG